MSSGACTENLIRPDGIAIWFQRGPAGALAPAVRLLRGRGHEGGRDGPRRAINTGDLAKRDREGYYTLVDRKKGHIAGKDPHLKVQNYVTSINVLALTAPAEGGRLTAYNIASGRPHSILDVARALDLLLAGHRLRARPRAHAARLPRGGNPVRPRDADLRRGRRDVPRARRVVDAGAPR